MARSVRLVSLGLLVFAACLPPVTPPRVVGETDCYDVDADGASVGSACTGVVDCDDADPAQRPGAPDSVGDSVDQDCDGLDGVDADKDLVASTQSGGTDCNDADAARFPGAPDTLGDGDQNCDGVDGVDGDRDGYASVASGGGDCDDTRADVNPGAADLVDGEGLDLDCDGADGVDGDHDAFASRASGGLDCDDTRGDVNPGASDVVDGNGEDIDCDGLDGVDGDGDSVASTASGGADCDDGNANVRPGRPDAVDPQGLDTNCDGIDGLDSDGDLFASEASGGEDCDDTDGEVRPRAPDRAGDGTDQDCDGLDGLDGDRDGHASRASGGDDCDDARSATNPGAADSVDANGLDSNCDGVDGVDADTDGFASRPSGGTDCDDRGAATYPGAPDTAGNGVDNDCDGVDGVDRDDDGAASVASGGGDCNDADPAISPLLPERYYDGDDDDCSAATPDDDQDKDGYRAASATGGDPDCNDLLAGVNPGVTTDPAGDRLDSNCDGIDGIDGDDDGVASVASGGTDCDDADPRTKPGAANAESLTACLRDADGDGWGDANVPAGVGRGTDCDDRSLAIHPGAVETYYDGVDQDCDSVRTPDADQDKDGVRATAATGSTPDCDDTNAQVRPGRSEVFYNFVDDDCDPSTEDDDQDRDGTGTRDEVPDCNDTDPDNWSPPCADCRDGDSDGVFVGCDAYVVRSGPDCDDTDAARTALRTVFRDVDGDGRGGTVVPPACLGTTIPAGYTAIRDDCDDTSAAHWADCTTCTDADGDAYGGGCDLGADCAPSDPAAFRVGPLHVDADRDGYGSTAAPTDRCYGAAPPAGYALTGTDCDDANAAKFRSGTFRIDADFDGFGGPDTRTDCQGATVDKGLVEGAATDCDDADPFTFPGAAARSSNTACQRDRDDDDYGDATASGGVTAGTDCDDADATVRPGAVDRPNDDADQDCAGGDALATETDFVFVATSGTDTAGCGSKASPCASVKQGLVVAGTAKALAVAEGTYDQGNDQLTTQVSIFGGYRLPGWTRPAGTTSRLYRSAAVGYYTRALLVRGPLRVVLDRVVIETNSVLQGSNYCTDCASLMVAGDEPRLLLVDSRVVGNVSTVESFGNAMRIQGTGETVIHRSTVIGATQNGRANGIVTDGCCGVGTPVLRIEQSVITSASTTTPSAQAGGTALLLSSGARTLVIGSQVNGGSLGWGEGIQLYEAGPTTVVNSVVRALGGDNASGINTYASTLTLVNVAVTAAVRLLSSTDSTLTVAHSTFVSAGFAGYSPRSFAVGGGGSALLVNSLFKGARLQNPSEYDWTFALARDSGAAPLTVLSNAFYLPSSAANRCFTSNGGAPNCGRTIASLNACAMSACTAVSGNVDDDPVFVNEGAYDYRLAVDSPVLDRGIDARRLVSSPYLQKDLAGRSRYADTGPDLGAYER